MEDADLIKDPEGFKAYAGVVSELEQNLRSVVNYPAVAQSVAEYGKAMLAEWVKQTPDWQTAIHAPGLRWSPSWNWDSDAAFAALHEYMATPAKVVAWRGIQASSRGNDPVPYELSARVIGNITRSM